MINNTKVTVFVVIAVASLTSLIFGLIYFLNTNNERRLENQNIFDNTYLNESDLSKPFN